jgi:hypothetical protein
MIALATCQELPSLDPDESLLVEAFARRGLEAVPVIWDDAKVEWSRFASVSLRNSWDYHEHSARFRPLQC